MSDNPTRGIVAGARGLDFDLIRRLEEARRTTAFASEILAKSKMHGTFAALSNSSRNFGFGSTSLAKLGQEFRQSDFLRHMAKVQADYQRLARNINGSLPSAYLVNKRDFLLPFERYNSQTVELMKALSSRAAVSLAGTKIAEQIAQFQTLGIRLPNAIELSNRLSAITKPWSVYNNEQASVAAAVRLSSFSGVMREFPALSRQRLALVNAEFGGFDGAFPVAENALTEEEGEATYTGSGRTQALVAFPSESYGEVLSATGLAFEIPQPRFVRGDGEFVTAARIDPEDHFLINMIEGHLRYAIFSALSILGGFAALSRLFGNRLPEWGRKRDDAVQRGEPELHPIYYADFMEMAELIINRELWATSFKGIFRNKDRIRVALERLHGFRIQTSHSRPLTRTARLRLWVEAREILEALGVVPRNDG